MWLCECSKTVYHLVCHEYIRPHPTLRVHLIEYIYINTKSDTGVENSQIHPIESDQLKEYFRESKAAKNI